MTQFSETMALGMQERGGRTLLEFLKERMDGVGRVEKRKSLKERLGLNGIGCCGAHWGFGPITILHDEPSPQQEPITVLAETSARTSCSGESPASGMNLATALATERQYRTGQDSDDGQGSMGQEINRPNSGPIEGISSGTPFRMSLMRLLHEAEDEDLENESREKVGCGMVCCVCMGRKKGAAFIPCGHTFCRVCSRELRLNRGSCPLCNCHILEILDIF